MEYLLANPQPQVDTAKFEKEAGVGVEVTPEQVESGVSIWFNPLLAIGANMHPALNAN